MKNCLPQCNFCKSSKQAEWEFVYGELPTHDYSFCCTEHIPDLIKSISKGRRGEVKVGYLKRWDTEGKYDPKWNESWSKFFRISTSIPDDNRPDYIKGLNRVLGDD